MIIFFLTYRTLSVFSIRVNSVIRMSLRARLFEFIKSTNRHRVFKRILSSSYTTKMLRVDTSPIPADMVYNQPSRNFTVKERIAKSMCLAVDFINFNSPVSICKKILPNPTAINNFIFRIKSLFMSVHNQSVASI